MKHHKMEDPMTATAVCIAGPLAVIGLGMAFHFFRSYLRDIRPFKHFRRDMEHVNSPHSCVSCGGTATELVEDPTTKVQICKDRATCRQTLIWRSQLDSMA